MNNTNTSTPCPNCDCTLPGQFCPECGQRRGELFPSIVSLFREFISESFALDGKLPQTLRSLIWPPAQLTFEWYTGRRVRFVSPLKLYIAAGFIFFLVWPLTPWADELISFSVGFTVGFQDLSQTSALKQANPATQRLVAALPSILVLFLVPIFATLIQMVARSAGGFATNLTLALHTHALAFVVTPLTIPIRSLADDGWGSTIAFIMIGSLAIYLTAALRKVHKLKLFPAFLRTALILTLYTMFIVLVISGSLIIILRVV